MGGKFNYFLTFSLLAVVIIIAYRYDQYHLKHNFVIHANVTCDIASASCFVADCSPEDDPDCDTTPYLKVDMVSASAPNCLEEHSCESFSCDGIAGCSITTCSDDTLEEGEVCVPQESDDVEVETEMTTERDMPGATTSEATSTSIE